MLSIITCPECGHRIEPIPQEVLRYGPLVLRADTGDLTVRGESRHLSPNPTRVLAHLMRHPEHVCPRDDLLTVCAHWDVYPAILLAEIYKIRKALHGTGTQVVNVWSKGYMLR